MSTNRQVGTTKFDEGDNGPDGGDRGASWVDKCSATDCRAGPACAAETRAPAATAASPARCPAEPDRDRERERERERESGRLATSPKFWSTVSFLLLLFFFRLAHHDLVFTISVSYRLLWTSFSFGSLFHTCPINQLPKKKSNRFTRIHRISIHFM